MHLQLAKDMKKEIENASQDFLKDLDDKLRNIIKGVKKMKWERIHRLATLSVYRSDEKLPLQKVYKEWFTTYYWKGVYIMLCFLIINSIKKTSQFIKKISIVYNNKVKYEKHYI